MKSAKDLANKLKDARAEIKQLRSMLERRDNLISDLLAREQAGAWLTIPNWIWNGRRRSTEP